MSKHLVIVESPAKAKTIERYLGNDYTVLASYGHVRDLPERELGVDVDHEFAPKYVVPVKAKKALSALTAAANTASDVFLATDYDREGEAIAWHIVEALGLEGSKEGKASKRSKLPIHRITFHEITKSAIQDAITHPRDLDTDLINAQQGRRVLDRLVGYKLSPFLWKKVMKGLSAGRVQSVAVRLVVEREREIRAFNPEEYWSMTAFLQTANQEALEANLVAFQGEKLDKLSIKTAERANELTAALKAADYEVANVEEKETTKRPSPPFTTSTLQQQASHRLHFSAKQTMKLAQDLYEAGHITYMRTDSTNLAGEALATARSFIQSTYGADYVPAAPVQYKTKAKGAQEAHEAIRPTDPSKQAGDLRLESERHAKLYTLIWQRMVASQMSPARVAATIITIEAGDGTFRSTGSVVRFPGYLKVWPTSAEDLVLPPVVQGESLTLTDLKSEQHFTEPPARFSEATLVKALEEYGIGRPSTYAPTLSTIIDRGYVQLIERRFQPTQIGEVVTDLLVENFPEIVDYEFTAQMEANLDSVAEGHEDWVRVLTDFYTPFAKSLSEKLETVQKKDLTEATDKVCPECGKPMVIRPGRFGKFLACTGFPDCRHTEAIVVKTGIQCPLCKEGDLIERKTRRGKTFWGCQRYPACTFATWDDPHKTPPVVPTPEQVAAREAAQAKRAATTKGKKTTKRRTTAVKRKRGR